IKGQPTMTTDEQTETNRHDRDRRCYYEKIMKEYMPPFILRSLTTLCGIASSCITSLYPPDVLRYPVSIFPLSDKMNAGVFGCRTRQCRISMFQHSGRNRY